MRCYRGCTRLACGPLPKKRRVPMWMLVAASTLITLAAVLLRAPHVAEMANFFWIGNGVNWATNNWSSTSGGASSGTQPGTGDDVIFDANSPGNCTLAASTAVRSIDFRGANPDGAHDFSHTFTHNAAVTLTLGTSTSNTVVFRLSTGMTYTPVNATTSSTSFASTAHVTETITTNGHTLAAVGLNTASPGGYQLQDNFSATLSGLTTLTLTQGTLDLNGKHVTAGLFASSNTNTRTLSFNGSTMELQGTSGTVWNMATVTGLTVNAANGTIYLSGNGTVTFAGGGKTYGALTLVDALTLTISGSNTFGAVTLTNSPASQTVISFTAGTTQTISSLTETGPVTGFGPQFQSTVGGSTWTLKCAAGIALIGSAGASTVIDGIASGGVPFYAGVGAALTNTTGWLASGPPLPYTRVGNATARSASW